MPQNAQSLVRHHPLPELPAVLPGIDVQHLWFRVAERRLAALAIVPVEPRVSTVSLAERMARVAADQAGSRVLVVNASLRTCRPPRTQPVLVDIVMDGLKHSLYEQVAPGCDYLDFSALHADDGERALTLLPQLLDYLAAEGKTYTSALFAVDSPLVQTRTIPLLRALDGVVLAVSLRQTSFAAARQVVDLVGRERVTAAIALR